MGKKPYVQPCAIDLSIEGVTGIGATSCNNVGLHFSSGSCGGGYGYTGVCTIGVTPTSGCTDRSIPNYQGGLCESGTATVGTCNDGTDVTGSHSLCSAGSNPSGYCDLGSSAQYKFSNNCGAGQSPAICLDGNAQPPISSS